MILLLTIACAPAFEGNFDDSQPVHDGWSVEATLGGIGMAAPGQALRVPIHAQLQGVPACQGCVVEHQAELQLAVRLPKTESATVNLSLMRESEVIVARSIVNADRALLSAPIFEGCIRSCTEALWLVVDADRPTELSWHAQGRSVSTLDRPEWSAGDTRLALTTP